MSHPSKRMQRVAELLQHHVATLLKTQLSDPRLSQVAITSVDVSPDLSNARVFFTVLEDSEFEQTQQLLNKAANRLRYLLAHKVALRRVPRLHFCFDQSIIQAERLDALLKQVENNHE